MISPKCGNSAQGEIEEFEINPKFKSIKMSNQSKSSNGEGTNFDNFSKQNSQGIVSRQSLKAQKLVINSDQNIKISNLKNSSNRIIKINPMSPDKKRFLRTVSGNASVKNMGKKDIDLDLVTHVKEKKRNTDTKKLSKKTSIISYNMSSLLSSGINQNETDNFRNQKTSSEESEEIKKLRGQLKKNERRVQRIVQGLVVDIIMGR
jgi:hypothetical protein